MTADEIIRIVKVAVGLGISRIKLTGGEPLMRLDVADIVKGIAALPNVTDLSMTTNGTLLGRYAEMLHANGLKRVNVSLPTLNREVYGKLTGGRLEDALDGVKTAVNVGFDPVKINMLVLKGINDSDIGQMINFAGETGAILQLIELEPINITSAYYSEHHKPLYEYEEALKREALEVETRGYMHNRHIYRLPNANVEVIHPIENTEFCTHCTRLRLTSDGKLKPCLMRNDNLVDVLTPFRSGASEEELAELFRQVNAMREPYNKE